jgi:beta-glucanase (GH16 family)
MKPGHLRSLPLPALLLATACGASAPPSAPPAAWELTWADEFDGAAGTSPDPARWVADIGGDGWGNRQLEYDTDSPDNLALDGAGHLVIRARRQSLGRNAYTSARIKTQGRFEQRYGRVEASLRLPSGRGVWPAFWMLGADFPANAWPACGEIDIMEMRGQEPAVVISSLHGPGYSAGASINSRYRLPEGRFDEGYHRFAVEWDPSRIVFLVDDEAYHTVTAAAVLGRGPWVFERPFFLLLNVAVGGDFVGPPGADTPFPQEMSVDWVRVYRRPS